MRGRPRRRELVEPSSRPGWLHAIFLLSGLAGLGYQIAFVRMLAVGLGHELPAALAVVGAFFGGFALGAWALDRPIGRSRRPGLWYAGLEAIIGLWCAACVWLVTPVNELALLWTGPMPSALRQWLVALGLPLLLLLPATAAMGATLPAMERLVSGVAQGGRHVGGLYAANTLGAVVGTLLSAFVLVPALGYRATVLGLAALNLACALGVLPWRGVEETGRAGLDPPGGPAEARGARRQEGSPPAPRTLRPLMLFCTGLLGIGYEIVVLRVLAQVIENTVYSYAAVLSVYLVGTAAGAAAWQRWQRPGSGDIALGRLLCVLSALCMLGGFGLAASASVYEFSRLSFGHSILGVLVSETLVAALALLGPTAAMGATFSLLAQQAKTASGGVGAALAVNTVGGFFAPLLVGVLLMPLVGTKWALAAVALGYLTLAGLGTRAPLWLAVPPLLLLALLPPQLSSVITFQGQTVIDFREGLMASVAVLENEKGHRSLRINNRFEMGDTGASGLRMQLRQGHIPLLLHPEPRRVLYLGLGTGITALAATEHPGLDVHAVELIPEVVDVLPAFAVDGRSLVERARVQAADARRFVRTSPERFDVIVADLFHPARDGSGMLYTREHFQAVRERLGDQGLFCQWLPTYQLDEPTLRDVIRTFLEVFPGARAALHDVELNFPAVALIGARGEWPRYQPGWIGRRVESEDLREALAEVDLDSDLSLFGMLVSDAAGLEGYAGPGPHNTDDHPIVVYRAPRITALLGQPRYGRLLALLREAPPEPMPWSIEDPELQTQLSRVLARRNDLLQRLGAQPPPRMIESTTPKS